MEKLFRNRDLNVSVRTVERDGEVLFYAKDVAESLGYSNPQKAVRDHVWGLNKVLLGKAKGVNETFTRKTSGERFVHPKNRQQHTVLLYESGVYQLTFKSRLPIAEDFQAWQAVVIPGLGEYQDTSSKRCDAWKKGYKGGQPDIIIENPMGKYKGFAIEFKSPKGTGVASEKQVLWFHKLMKIGYM
ncbi:toxin Bro, partial [Paramuricea clavata]